MEGCTSILKLASYLGTSRVWASSSAEKTAPSGSRATWRSMFCDFDEIGKCDTCTCENRTNVTKMRMWNVVYQKEAIANNVKTNVFKNVSAKMLEMARKSEKTLLKNHDPKIRCLFRGLSHHEAERGSRGAAGSPARPERHRTVRPQRRCTGQPCQSSLR